MRLVTFNYQGEDRLGALEATPQGATVLDLNHADPRLPSGILAFLRAGAPALDLAEEALDGAPASARLPLDRVRLRAPITVPGKIMCIGRNYAEHAAEGSAEVPTSPVVFAKFSNAVIGPGEPILLPEISQEVDYEGELAVVIGQQARSVSEAGALAHVGGYMAFNDVSARDLQFRTSQWMIGKTLDTFAPMGPALITADEIPDPQALSLRTIVSGELLQNGHTRDMIFSVAYLVSYLSHILTLEPGDVIATGTPSGVGQYRKPPRFLHAGDVVRIEIERVGVLENPVQAAG